MYRSRKKCVYHRKYVLNVMNDIAQKNRMQIGYYNREKILRIFKLIDQVSQGVDTGRKRIFDILGIEYKSIPLTKSKKTLNYYNLWWKRIYRLLKDDINRLKGIFCLLDG